MADKVHIYAVALGATDKALKCDVGAKDGKSRWIPQSLIDDDSEVYKPGQRGDLVIPEWFALKEGLI